jgi:hypothetical protein
LARIFRRLSQSFHQQVPKWQEIFEGNRKVAKDISSKTKISLVFLANLFLKPIIYDRVFLLFWGGHKCKNSRQQEIFFVKVTCRAGLSEAPQMGVNSTNLANVFGKQSPNFRYITKLWEKKIHA